MNDDGAPLTGRPVRFRGFRRARPVSGLSGEFAQIRGMKTALFAIALCLVTTGRAADLTDFDSARQALELGRARPLTELLPMIERETKGHVIEVEFELDEKDTYVYEFELIAPDGRLLKAIVDAASGGILSIDEHEED